MPELRLTIPGEPVGKGRPKARVVRAGKRPVVTIYTPAATRKAEAGIRELWEREGALRLPEGGLEVELRMVFARPAGHFRKGGELSAEGLRHPVPFRSKPDVDNALKLVLDALNGAAWTDDVRVVRGEFSKTWGDWPRMEFVARAVADESDNPEGE